MITITIPRELYLNVLKILRAYLDIASTYSEKSYRDAIIIVSEFEKFYRG